MNKCGCDCDSRVDDLESKISSHDSDFNSIRFDHDRLEEKVVDLELEVSNLKNLLQKLEGIIREQHATIKVLVDRL